MSEFITWLWANDNHYGRMLFGMLTGIVVSAIVRAVVEKRVAR